MEKDKNNNRKFISKSTIFEFNWTKWYLGCY